jgi:hypothetical protein
MSLIRKNWTNKKGRLQIEVLVYIRLIYIFKLEQSANLFHLAEHETMKILFLLMTTKVLPAGPSVPLFLDMKICILELLSSDPPGSSSKVCFIGL